MRTLFFLIIFICAVTLPVYVSIALALIYAFRYFSPELLIIAFVIDGYFGTSLLPLYTLATLFGLIAVEWYKSFSSFYNTK